jgi:hypothetical protein
VRRPRALSALAGAGRRRRERRAPRIAVHDAQGARTVAAGDEQGRALLAAAERVLAAAEERERSDG